MAKVSNGYVREQTCKAVQVGLRTDIKDLKKEINTIRTNDLFHIDEKIDKMNDHLINIKNWMIGVLGSVISAAIIFVVFK